LEWVNIKTKFLQKAEEINSVNDAQRHQSLLEAYNKEKERLTATTVAGFNKLGASIIEARYNSEYSKHEFENPKEILDREKYIRAQWKILDIEANKKKEILKKGLAVEEEKERLRLHFATQAAEFTRWTKDQEEQASSTQFGFNLPEVEAFKETLSQDDQRIENDANGKQLDYTNVESKMKQMGVNENIYTKDSIDSLAALKKGLDGSLAERRVAYEKELARQRHNDQLCKNFAAVGEELAKWIISQKDKISGSKDDLEDQLKYVQSCQASCAGADAKRLIPVKEASDKMDAAGIQTNPHTTLTYKDLEVQFNSYQSFLSRKSEMLVQEIENSKLKGLTAQDLKEILDNFSQFDENGDKFLVRHELKACLYSLGEEKTNAEIDAILKEYGQGDKGITEEQFIKMMVTLFAVSSKKEDILDAFFLMTRGAPVTTVEKMELAGMDPESIAYVKATAPAKEGGYDTQAWTETVFSK
jgi:hypothetical protein